MSKYEVFARKYRPRKLSELVGQDVLVKTLTSAIEQNRVPHAFILTGIRGVGKTTTARIIAKSLNYVGADGNAEMAAETDDGCPQCIAIDDGCHPDVIEMDAASRTGVGDIREIIDSVNYKPVMGRYKVYIIDEVHMLSKSAFNALLKTLEEPPSHAKFIFATTEIRKIPVTVLSRCIRFDLPRVSKKLLINHLTNISNLENKEVEEGGLTLIANAAEGSVRDAVSLLDQAIGSYLDGGKVSQGHVEKMLGLAGKEEIYKLFDFIVQGKTEEMINQIRYLFSIGNDPLAILQDLLQVLHVITLMRTASNTVSSMEISEIEYKNAEKYKDSLGLAVLSRIWQMLQKGIYEVQTSGNPLIAAEMLLIRVVYSASLPTPDDLLRATRQDTQAFNAQGGGNVAKNSDQGLTPEFASKNKLKSFEEVVEIFHNNGESMLYSHLCNVKPVQFNAEKYIIEFFPDETAPADLASRVATLLQEWTGQRWVVAISQNSNKKTLRQKQDENLAKERDKAINDGAVQAMLSSFDGAKIIDVKVSNDKNINSDKNDNKESFRISSLSKVGDIK